VWNGVGRCQEKETHFRVAEQKKRSRTFKMVRICRPDGAVVAITTVVSEDESRRQQGNLHFK
jgi:hypothetical protein